MVLVWHISQCPLLRLPLQIEVLPLTSNCLLDYGKLKQFMLVDNNSGSDMLVPCAH